MQSTLRLNAKILPVIAVLALIMQFVDPSRVWIILLIGIGGAWLICWWWARGLARSLHFEREIRFDWAQVGDNLEERFTLKNPFMLPATWVTIHDHSTLVDHHTSIATGVVRDHTRGKCTSAKNVATAPRRRTRSTRPALARSDIGN